MKLKAIFIIVAGFLAMASNAQKKELIESKDAILEQAAKELNEAIQAPKGSLFLFKQLNNIRGEYTIDITIREKGDIASVFMVESKDSDIKMQNMVKDKIRLFEFSFKVPKGKLYKFQHVFNFN